MNQDSVAAVSRDGEDHVGSAILWTIDREVTTSAYRPPDGRPVPIPSLARWVLGAAIGVAGLVGLTSVVQRGVESTLSDRTEESLRNAGLDPADFVVHVDFRDVTITGTPPEGWDERRLLTVVDVADARSIVIDNSPSPTSEDSDS
ncbi:MAG: hypothetical protein R2710_01555 [Acidimicrobiales bacterium]